MQKGAWHCLVLRIVYKSFLRDPMSTCNVAEFSKFSVPQDAIQIVQKLYTSIGLENSKDLTMLHC